MNGDANIPERLAEWATCKRCGLHRYRRQVVFGRGVAPADILFIGEAPGRSEDLRGQAFVGRAGRILDSAIKDATALAKLPEAPSYYITNTVGCIPLDQKGGQFREPSRAEALACWGRLEMTARHVAAIQTILLGNVAQLHCGARYPGALTLRHPAYILRRGGTASGEYRTFVRELSDVFKLCGPNAPRSLAPRDIFGDSIGGKNAE